MECTVDRKNDIVLVSLNGRMDAQAANETEETCVSLIEGGTLKFVFDLDKLDYISSAGLRVLLAVAKQLKAKEGIFKICGVKEYVREVFDITGFTPIFDLYDTKEEALESF